MPKFTSARVAESDSPGIEYEFVQKHLDIDDDPIEDILIHLKDACDWVKAGLESGQQKAEGDDQEQVGVLVHCTQGISRSGSIVIAYCEFIYLFSTVLPDLQHTPTISQIWHFEQ